MAARNALLAVLLALSVMCAMGARQLPAANTLAVESTLNVGPPVAYARNLLAPAPEPQKPKDAKDAKVKESGVNDRFDLVNKQGEKGDDKKP